MSIVRAFLSGDAVIEDSVCVLDERESHHLGRVLRVGPQDTVELLDGAGAVHRGIIASSAKSRRLSVRILESRHYSRRERGLVLALGMPKQKAFDGILRAATEMGVWAIEILFTERSEVRWREAEIQGKLEKARQTLMESSKQCGLPFLPRLAAPRHLRDWVEEGGKRGWVGSLRGDPPRLRAALEVRPLAEPGEYFWAVGPEGDFSAAEYDQLEKAGFEPVRLGDFTLRTETAAIYGMAVIDQCL